MQPAPRNARPPKRAPAPRRITPRSRGDHGAERRRAIGFGLGFRSGLGLVRVDVAPRPAYAAAKARVESAYNITTEVGLR